MLIDTHAHLNFLDYGKDLETVIENALTNGVNKIICASSNLDDSRETIELTQKYPGIVYALVGIHPQKTDPENKDSLEIQIKQLDELAQEKGVAGIGECGLDYSPTPPNETDRGKEEQYFLFEEQIKIALKYNLPVCVHSRKSSDETVAFLTDKYRASGGKLRGVLHCYAAGRKNVAKLLEIGFYFGLDGNLTYDEGLQNVAKEIPLKSIVLETDSPFLSPIPYRGLRNEPKNVKLIADCLAKLKSVSPAEIAGITTKNARCLFNV